MCFIFCARLLGRRGGDIPIPREMHVSTTEQHNVYAKGRSRSVLGHSGKSVLQRSSEADISRGRSPLCQRNGEDISPNVQRRLSHEGNVFPILNCLDDNTGDESPRRWRREAEEVCQEDFASARAPAVTVKYEVSVYGK